MADGKAEISDVNNINVPHVVIIQALVRGNLVRWRLEKLRRAYEQVFSEIERHDSHHVEWKHDSPCFPKIEKGTPTQRAFHKNINNDKQKKAVKAADRNRKDFGTSTAEQHSVEVQTSFIDLTSQTVSKLSESSGPCVKTETWENILDDLPTKDHSATEIIDLTDGTDNVISGHERGRNRQGTSDETAEFKLDLNLSRESDVSPRSEHASHGSKGDSISMNARPSVEKMYTGDTRILKANDRKHVNKGHSFEGGNAGTQEPVNEVIDLSDDYDDEVIIRKPDRKVNCMDNEKQYSDRSDGSKTSRKSYLNSGRDEKYYKHKEVDDIEQIELQSQGSGRSDKSSSRTHRSEKRSARDNEFEGRVQRSDRSERSSSRSEKYSSKENDHDIHGHRSDSSERSQQSDKMLNKDNATERANRSERSNSRLQRSERYSSKENDHENQGHRSDRSERSQKSEKRSIRIEKPDRSPRAEDVMSPRMSSQSPVSHMSRSGRLDHISTAASRREKPVQSVIDSTSLTNVTSVWDSYNSIPDMPDVPLSLPDDKEELQQMRKNIAMELLWVQQAIDSRKNYLKLKGSM
ncbi:protein starmaker-like [Mya arenaria]|uniref:protein starmaker-like n=1 Tax=Mya arenaria TaxID=6604 RepID=UPI0022E3089A|nr:protein starmaker-like [Mya arenaria]